MESLDQDVNRTNISSTGTYHRARIRIFPCSSLLLTFFMGFSQIGLSQTVEIEPNDFADDPQVIEGKPHVIIEGSLQGKIRLDSGATKEPEVGYDPVDYFQFTDLERHGFDSYVVVTRANFDMIKASLLYMQESASFQ